ncbi:CREB-regulated transcription coactivator 1-like [Megalops cyprinoides]|uniref:CREB-regulated transcription coactivator 1-like n=1 Tax=Megalops cyprinoides TaxID=118141 RepID=UPI001863C15D|nr:CREB-regulated transcription coactivator 1-like [Megalops cyprinoides]
MSAAGTGAGAGGCGPGPGSGGGSGTCNPRKFSEKIALHTQRQAEETAAFQEVMMDITSTRLQAQKVRLARSQGQYFGGSLPNVNQIGRNTSDLQGHFHTTLESSRSTRHHGLVERVHRDRRFTSPVRPYRRQTDSSPYNSAYLSPPPDPSWRRNWSRSFPVDKTLSAPLPITALNRTNSDSALHTSVMTPLSRDPLSGHTLTPQSRHSGQAEGVVRKMFPYPVPPIEENMIEEGRLLKPWDAKKLPMLSSRPKSCEVPGINISPSPDQPSGVPHIPAALNAGGSLPDLTTLHFPSPLPTPLDQDEPGPPSLSGGSSTGNLASTLTQLGITAGNAFHLPGLSASHQGTYSNPLLQSSLSNPNIQSSLSSHSIPNSLSSTSLHSSLSNPSLQSSLSNQSLQSSLSNSSLSGHSLHSATSNPSFSSGVGGSGSCSSSTSSAYAPMGQVQSPLATSPRKRTQLSPLIVPIGGDSRRHHPKQFSPTISPTLSSITQGVPLDTSKLSLDQRLPAYPYTQLQAGPPASHQPLQQTQHQQQQHHHQQQQQPEHHQHPQHQNQQQQHAQQPLPQQQQHPHQQPHSQQQQYPQQQPPLQQQQYPQQQQHPQQQQYQHQYQQHQQHQQQQQQPTSQCSQMEPRGLQLLLQSQQNAPMQRPVAQPLPPTQMQQGATDHQQRVPAHTDQLQHPSMTAQVGNTPASALGLFADTSMLSSFLDDPYLGMQLSASQSQALLQQLGQFSKDTRPGGQTFNHGSGCEPAVGTGNGGPRSGDGASQGTQGSGDTQFLNKQNQNQSQGFSGGSCHNLPNIILTGDSSGLSKEITSALSGVPGFEMDAFGLDDPLQMDPLALEGLSMLAEGDLMLPDPAVEDSFRSDRL